MARPFSPAGDPHDRSRDGGTQNVDVTGAWDVTITMSNVPVSGLAVLSQDGIKVTGMLGAALTDMFPVEGTWDGDKLTILARPRRGRTTAPTKYEVAGTHDRMTGTIDADKGKIEFVRRKREG
jgi:hypothetical protein